MNEVSDKLRQFLDKAYSVRMLEKAANHAIALIKLRVQSGVDLARNPFQEYTLAYRRQKIRDGAYSGRVDLTATGAMLRDMKINVTRNLDSAIFEMEVGYIEGKSTKQSIDKAQWHNVDGAGKKKVKRTFVGLTDQERRQIFDKLKPF